MSAKKFLAAVVVGIVILLIPVVGAGSETDLVNASYIGVPLLAFGTVGHMRRETPQAMKMAIRAGISVLVLLFVFYQLIWPSL